MAQANLVSAALPSPPLAKTLTNKWAENHWLIYLLVVSPVLFRVSRYEISVATTGLAEPLSIIEIALFLAVLYQVFVRWFFQHKSPVILCRSDIYVFLFLLAAGTSVVALLYEPVGHSESLKAFVRLMEYVGLYLIISTNIRSWQAVRKLLIFLVGCGIAVSFLAFVQYFMGPFASASYFRWGTWFNAFVEANNFRAYSFFFNPLYVSAYLSIVWPINLGLLMGERRRKYRSLYLVSLLVNCGGILITFCRSGLVGLAVALFIFAKERTRIAIAAGLMALLIGSYLIPDELRVRLFLEDQESRDSISVRMDRYKEGLELFVEHPVLGVGFGNYQSYNYGGDPGSGESGYSAPTEAEINASVWLRRDYQGYTAENTFIQYSGEMGIMGIIAFLAICVHFLYILWRMRKKSAAAEGWVIGIFAGLLSFLACSMFTTLTAVEMNSAFWVLLGITKAVWLRRPQREAVVGSGRTGNAAEMV